MWWVIASKIVQENLAALGAMCCALTARPLGSRILHALIELLSAGIEAVLSAGKDIPCLYQDPRVCNREDVPPISISIAGESAIRYAWYAYT